MQVKNEFNCTKPPFEKYWADAVSDLSTHLNAKLSSRPRSCRKLSGRLGKDFSSFFWLGGLRIPMISRLMVVLSYRNHLKINMMFVKKFLSITSVN